MVAAPPSESEPRLRCWRCKEASPPAFFCPHCEAVQTLPSDSNYSALLGFGGGPSVDEAALSDRYYTLSRRLHPDRFQTGSPEEQRASLQATALLNAAFKTLRDVESRGRWWLEREGESLGRDNNQVPPALAGLVFEVQEQIEEASRASGDARGKIVDQLERTKAELTRRRNEERATVEELLQEWPEDGARAASSREELKRRLSELSYLRTLARDVGRALED